MTRQEGEKRLSLERVPKFDVEAGFAVRWPSKAVVPVFSTALEGHRTQFRDTLLKPCKVIVGGDFDALFGQFIRALVEFAITANLGNQVAGETEAEGAAGRLKVIR